MLSDRDDRWLRQKPNSAALPRGVMPADCILVGSAPVPLRALVHHDAWATLRDLFDSEQEHIGLLLGEVYGDEEGPFIVVEDVLPAPHTRLTSGGLTFTDRSWEALGHTWEERHRDRLVVGSFRLRPGGGTSLSPYDQFHAERFFPEWHHLHYVVDFLRQRQGLYHWSNHRLQALAGFWVCTDSAPTATGGYVSMPDSLVVSAAAATREVGFEPKARLLAGSGSGAHGSAAGPTASKPAARPRRSRTSLGLLGLVLLLLLPWACVSRIPGSLPEMQRRVKEASAASAQLAAVAAALRTQNEQLERALAELALPELDQWVSGATVTGSGTPSDEAAVAGPSDASIVPDGVHYTVRQGDTLWSISSRLLGNPYAYGDLADDNNIVDPDLILPGWELRLPAE